MNTHDFDGDGKITGFDYFMETEGWMSDGGGDNNGGGSCCLTSFLLLIGIPALVILGVTRLVL